MDTSETYIKMCDCEEIQGIKIKKRLPSHLICEYWQTTDKQIIDLDGDILAEVEDACNISNTRYIWLPRQDQLQEMIGLKVWDLEDEFYNFCHQNNVEGKKTYGSWNDYTGNLTSMEQLWLAFLFAEKYNKVWDGSDWVLKR